MDGGPLSKRRKTKAPRGEDNVLLAIHRSHHQILPMDIQSHETRGWRRNTFREHFFLLLSALRKQSGWMRRVIRACGKSLTNTSLPMMGSLSSGLRAGAASNETGSDVPCAYDGQP